LFYALLELFSKVRLMKTAQSQQDDVEIMVVAGRTPLTWLIGRGYGEKIKQVYRWIWAKVTEAS